MFIDTAKINIKAGNGGNGSVSFHREKYVAAGGPDGGDGGRGGNVVFVADSNLSTLMDFRYKRKYAAQNGEDGRAARCSGKNAPDLIIRVPRGTLVRDAQSGLVIADISGDEPVVVARGGRGGWGNVHFATPTRQLPKFATPGGKGVELEVRLERWAFRTWARAPSFLSSARPSPKSPTTISPLFRLCWVWCA